MCMTRSTVVCHLHLRNKIIPTLGQPLTSGTGTSARLTVNNRIMANGKSSPTEHEQYERCNYGEVGEPSHRVSMR